MSQIIIIENDNLKFLLSKTLSAGLGVEISCFNSADQAIEFIKKSVIFPLVITRAKMGKEETAEKIYEYLSSEGQIQSMIIMGEHPLKAIVSWIPQPVVLDELIKLSSKKLTSSYHHNEPGFHPVLVQQLDYILEAPCDIYLRIRKGDLLYQFVKIIHQADRIDKNKIERYRKLNLEEVYISSGSVNHFYNLITKSLAEKLTDNSLETDSKIRANAEAFKIVRTMIKEFELYESTFEVSEVSMKSIVNTIESSREISSLFVFLLTNDVSSAYLHYHLRSLICYYVLSKQSWYKRGHLSLLTFASFYADISLDTPEEMFISNTEEFYTSFPEESRFKLLFRPRESLEIAQKHPAFNEFIKTILLQCNGNADGFGLEENPGESLNILSKIFIIADTFVRILVDPKRPSTKKEILHLLSDRYTNPSYQIIIKCLEQKFI